ncbi:hypothetical protein [Sphingomonas sinipercae]|uniref:hypothetical protein n=1 Tax=Sphingomonas sinipercae TaxID=2714944 RepID=UPI0031B618F4
MPEATEAPARQPAVFTIPSHRSFADALVAGLLARFGTEPTTLAAGRILLPNNRAVRSITDAFVRASGGGLVLPRLIPIGDPELEERVGGALDLADTEDQPPPAVEPLARLLALAELVRGENEGAAEALRMASDLGRTLDALLIEEVEPARLKDAVVEDLARHWQVSLDRLRAIVKQWPERLGDLGAIDLAERRNLLLHRLAKRWSREPPTGFTVAAGVTTAAPAVAELVRTVAYMPGGLVVLPGLSLPSSVPDAEWDALGPDETGRGEETHPQFHLKLLLGRLGINRAEVRLWPRAGRASSPPARGRAVANAMAAADFSHKWNALKPADRRLSGIRVAELSDPAAEAQAISLGIRQALEVPGKTIAFVTPDRVLARRVSALLARWGWKQTTAPAARLRSCPRGRFSWRSRRRWPNPWRQCRC